MAQFVGIDASLVGSAPFNATLKARWTDFKVNEISKDGKVVQLNSFTLPVNNDAIALTDDAKHSALTSLSELLSEDFVKFCGQLNDKADDVENIVDDVLEHAMSDDKGERRRVYELMRSAFPHLSADAAQKADGKQYIIVQRKSNSQTGQKRGRSAPGSAAWKRSDWPANRPPYLQFVLHKHNIDTISAIGGLCKNAGLKEKIFGYAGTKDKRAATSQLVTVHKIEPAKLVSAVRKTKGAYVGNFSFVPEPLRLGDLCGNQFEIVLRNVSTVDNDTTKASAVEMVAKLREVISKWKQLNFQFINYFGLQRFGSMNTQIELSGEHEGDTLLSGGSHIVGIKLLQADYKGAIMQILTPKRGDSDEVARSRNAFVLHNDIDQALQTLPAWCHIERKILRSIANSGGIDAPGACFDALFTIPPKQRSMYMHALQSYLWNRMASFRIITHGLSPIVGDLVLANAPPLSKQSADGLLCPDVLLEGSYPLEATDSDDDSVEKDIMDAANSGPSKTYELPMVRTLTEEDIASGGWSIRDILLPLPGYSVNYPQDELYLRSIAKWLVKLGFPLSEGESDNNSDIQIDNYSLETVLEFVQGVFKPKDRRFQLCGGYRRVIEQAYNLSWKLMMHDNENQDLIITDVDLMRGKVLSNEVVTIDPDKESESSLEAKLSKNHKNLSLYLKFSLVKSAYATMAMREVANLSSE